MDRPSGANTSKSTAPIAQHHLCRIVPAHAMHAAAVGGLEQWKLSRVMLGHIADAISYSHHFLGVLGQEEGYYLDLPGLRSQTLPFSGEASDWETLMKADSFFASALEHGVLAQTQGTNRPAALFSEATLIVEAAGRFVTRPPVDAH